MPPPPPPFLHAEWAERGILEIRYARAIVLTEDLADQTIRWLDSLLAEFPEGFALLVDVGNVEDATAGYRTEMGRWFRANSHRLRMAIYHMEPLVRVMALLFALATRLPIKFAGSREEAMSWLDPLPAR